MATTKARCTGGPFYEALKDQVLDIYRDYRWWHMGVEYIEVYDPAYNEQGILRLIPLNEGEFERVEKE